MHETKRKKTMKKLMTAVAVALSAIALNAASVDWSFSEMAMTANEPYSLNGYTAYLFTADTWEGAKISAALFNSAVASSGLTFTDLGNGMVSKWETGTQTWTDNAAASGDYFIVISDGKKYVASDALAATAYASAQEAHDAATWTILTNQTPLAQSDFKAVPEPTSGLLLLLGMAGLALKRKRA